MTLIINPLIFSVQQLLGHNQQCDKGTGRSRNNARLQFLSVRRAILFIASPTNLQKLKNADD
jgi:hypothetical protein